MKNDIDKRKPIGDYHIEIDHDNFHTITLIHTDGRQWSDHARAMSHLMTELSHQRAEFEEAIKKLECDGSESDVDASSYNQALDNVLATLRQKRKKI